MLTVDSLLGSGAPPLIAILRGITPDEAPAVGAALLDAGISLMEVPLNSPDPFTSIARLQAEFGDRVLVGAGTVLDVAAVDRLAGTGARLLVTPNTNPAVIARALGHHLETIPGVLTPTEAFAAVAAGARRLKVFPAFVQGPRYLGALAEVLPRQVRLWAVGGVDAGNIGEWLAAGAEGVAIASGLYRAGLAPAEVRERALRLVDAAAAA